MANKTSTSTRTKNKTTTSKKKTATRSKSTDASKKTPKSSSSPKRRQPSEKDIEDSIFLKDSTKDIILLCSIAICILLMISNFGIGGTIGSALAGFLFGTFGLIQYILPLWFVFCLFWIISNYGNKIIITKLIASFVLLIFFSGFVELIVHGQDMLSATEAFEFSKEYHYGGGYLGGGIVYFFYNSFGLFGAYLVDIIIMAISVIIISEHFIFWRVQQSSRVRSDRAAARRRRQREQRLMEQDIARNGRDIQYSTSRQATIDKIEKDRIRQQKEENNTSGPRSSRKRTGVTANTNILEKASAAVNDEVSEVKINTGFTDVEVESTSRHKLKANKPSASKVVAQPEDVQDTVKEIVFSPVDDIKPVTPQKPADFSLSSPVINIPSAHIETEKPVLETKVKDTEPSKTITDNKSAVSESMEHEPIAQKTIAREPVESEPAANSTPSRSTKKASLSSAEEIEESATQVSEAVEKQDTKPKKPYQKPPLSLLNDAKKGQGDSKEYLSDMANKLQRTLSNFGVEAKVVAVTLGPSVTQYKIQIDAGVKVSKVINLSDDIKLNMAVTDVRIEAPIPGEPYIGIEVPNKEKTMVGFKELASSTEFTSAKSKIAFCVGKDINGNVIVGNIEKMPHLLIAGATGSGKSVCINTIIMSILYHATPDEVKMIMVDPKMVELSVYNGIPHLLIPVVTDAKKAAGALHWAVKEMTDRYELLAKAGVRNIEGFNEKVEQDALPDEIPEDRRKKLPQLIIILDELADLMMVAASDVEDSIVRLAQLARAAGMHLIIATQRPTSNVITGLIKANVPSRIAFSVSSSIDSRVIIDMNGAEELLGNGDMLYAPQNESKPRRLQGAFVSDDEVARVVDFLKNKNDNSDYDKTITEAIEKTDVSGNSVSITGDIDNSRDALFEEAGRLVIESQKGSIGYLQRNFRIGFNRAARIMDQLSEAGVVGPDIGTKPREIKMTLVEFEELLNAK